VVSTDIGQRGESSGRGESTRESSQLADQLSRRGDQQPNSMLRGKSTVRYTGMWTENLFASTVILMQIGGVENQGFKINLTQLLVSVSGTRNLGGDWTWVVYHGPNTESDPLVAMATKFGTK